MLTDSDLMLVSKVEVVFAKNGIFISLRYRTSDLPNGKEVHLIEIRPGRLGLFALESFRSGPKGVSVDGITTEHFVKEINWTPSLNEEIHFVTSGSVIKVPVDF